MEYQHSLELGNSSIIVLDSIYALTSYINKDDQQSNHNAAFDIIKTQKFTNLLIKWI